MLHELAIVARVHAEVRVGETSRRSRSDQAQSDKSPAGYRPNSRNGVFGELGAVQTDNSPRSFRLSGPVGTARGRRTLPERGTYAGSRRRGPYRGRWRTRQPSWHLHAAGCASGLRPTRSQPTGYAGSREVLLAGFASGRFQLAELVGLCAFAIAKPLFDLMVRNPGFLVSQQVSPLQLVVLVD